MSSLNTWEEVTLFKMSVLDSTSTTILWKTPLTNNMLFLWINTAAKFQREKNEKKFARIIIIAHKQKQKS